MQQGGRVHCCTLLYNIIAPKRGKGLKYDSQIVQITKVTSSSLARTGWYHLRSDVSPRSFKKESQPLSTDAANSPLLPSVSAPHRPIERLELKADDHHRVKKERELILIWKSRRKRRLWWLHDLSARHNIAKNILYILSCEKWRIQNREDVMFRWGCRGKAKGDGWTTSISFWRFFSPQRMKVRRV